jgi:hypothetical protein
MLQKGYEKYKREWEQRQNEEFLKEYKVESDQLRKTPGLVRNTTPKYWTFWNATAGKTTNVSILNLFKI